MDRQVVFAVHAFTRTTRIRRTATSSRLVQQNRSSCFSLDPELIDRSGLGQTVALHLQVQVTVVLDRVAIGVEQSRVPIAQGLVAFGAVGRQADVPAGDGYIRVNRKYPFNKTQ